MNLLQPAADPGSAAFLADRWRALALSEGWLRPDDWYGAAVGSMVRAVIAGDGLDPAARELGADRAARGVGISEGLRDLDALYRAAAQGEPPFTVVRAFTEQWVEVATSALLAQGSTDALTGLRTLDYLQARLRELYAEQGETAVATHEAWSLIVIQGDVVTGWRRVLRSCAIARVVSGVLCAGQTNAILPSGVFVSVTRTSTADEHRIRLQHRLLAVDDMESVTIETRPLPRESDAALELVLGL